MGVEGCDGSLADEARPPGERTPFSFRFMREGVDAAATREDPDVRGEFSTPAWGVYEYTSRGTVDRDPPDCVRRSPHWRTVDHRRCAHPDHHPDIRRQAVSGPRLFRLPRQHGQPDRPSR